jgi:hypothetical protein
MPETMPCPHCKSELALPDDLLGKEVQCPNCRQTFPAEPAGRVAPTRQFSAGEGGFAAPPAPAPPPVPSGSPPVPAPPAPTTPGAAPRKPAEVDYIAHMMLYGGIWALAAPLLYYLASLVLGATTGFICCCLNPFMLYSFVLGGLSITTALKLRGPEGYLRPPPRRNAVLQMINLVNFDVPNAVMGFLAYSWLGRPEVAGYYQGRPASAGQTKVFQGHGIQFRYPSTWRVEARKQEGVDAWHIVAESDTALVQVFVYPPLISPEAALNTMIETVRQNARLGNVTVTRQAGTLAGQPSLVAQYRFLLEGRYPGTGWLESAAAGPHILQVLWQAPDATLAERRPDAELIRGSLAVTG